MPARTPQGHADDFNFDWQATNPTPTPSASTDSNRKDHQTLDEARVSPQRRVEQPFDQSRIAGSAAGRHHCNEPATCRRAGIASGRSFATWGLLVTAAVGRKKNAVLPAQSSGVHFSRAAMANDCSPLNFIHNTTNGWALAFMAVAAGNACPRAKLHVRAISGMVRALAGAGRGGRFWAVSRPQGPSAPVASPLGRLAQHGPLWPPCWPAVASTGSPWPKATKARPSRRWGRSSPTRLGALDVSVSDPRGNTVVTFSRGCRGPRAPTRRPVPAGYPATAMPSRQVPRGRSPRNENRKTCRAIPA